MTQQIQSNSFNMTIEEAKATLKKYCYFNQTSLTGEQLRAVTCSLIDECSNDFLLIFMCLFFNRFIKCFYNEYRTFFNKLRSFFMEQVLASLLLSRQLRLDISSFKIYYSTWLNQANFADYVRNDRLFFNKVKEVENFYLEILRLI